MGSDNNRIDALSRRDFVRGTAVAAGAGLMMGNPVVWAQEAAETKGNADELAVAIIGVGSQGGNLLNRCLHIPGIRFVAVCDIWPFWLKRTPKASHGEVPPASRRTAGTWTSVR